MKQQTLNMLMTLRRNVDSVAERFELRGEDEAAEFLVGISEEINDFLKQSPRYVERITVRFQHDKQEKGQ